MTKLYVSNKDESVRIFQSDFLERFTHVHHSVPLAIFLPVVLYFLYRTHEAGINAGRAALLYTGGLIFWTVLEYTIHRFGFHVGKKAERQVQDAVGRLPSGSGALKVLRGWEQTRYFLAHGVHHTHPNDSRRLVMPPVVSIPLALMFHRVLYVLFGPVDFLPAFAGLVSGYVIYDMLHHAVHHVRPRTALGRYLKKHHFRHHYQDPDKNFGVTSPFWDVVCGTLSPRRTEGDTKTEAAS